MMVLLGSRGLETAVANGDTRTLTMHHMHTDEDITITYKRNGQYDEEALKKLDWFLRDWRKEESTGMDPQLFDLLWEVSQEFGGKTIQVVCGYRSPATNAMLRKRSSGVAQHSQHMLGKATDFYIPGVPLEDLREAGLRLQRGGVGYYPTSGSPFVHLDVGSVRMWPRMSHEQLARVFPNGRTAYLAADGKPLSGYAQARADTDRRTGANNVTRTAAVDVAPTRKKNPMVASFTSDTDDDASTAKPSTATAAPARQDNYRLASVTKPSVAKAEPAKAEPKAQPMQLASASTRAVTLPPAQRSVPVASVPADLTSMTSAAVQTPVAVAAMAQAQPVTLAVARTSDTPPRGDWATEPPRPPASIENADVTGTPSSPSTDKDRVPLDMVLAYAAQPQRSDRDVISVSRLDPSGPAPARAAIAAAVKSAAPHDNITTVAITTVPKKALVHAPAPASAEQIHRAKPVTVTADAGMRYDDPWLRAMILAPSLTDSMTATVYGEPDLTELRALMRKPSASLALTFKSDAYPGIVADRFSGDAVVFLTTTPFTRRTASLQ